MPCNGNSEEHCCWLDGAVCPFLEENTVPGRRWACGLRRKYGNWDDAIASKEYLNIIDPHFQRKDLKDQNLAMNCRDWPDQPAGTKCFACGFGIE